MRDRPLDPDCLRYVEHWEPVLSAASRRTLERIDAEPATLLDLGAGTGSLTLASAQRWPAAKVVALDASAAMLAVARTRALETGADPHRFRWFTADAAHAPLDDGTVDAAASSFMLQLVDDRAAVLAEMRRVLRPGGTFSFVTWLADDLVLAADEVYHKVMGDISGDDEDDEVEGFRSPRSGDYASLEQARDELAEAGFEALDVVRDELHYAWTPDSYLAYKVFYDDRERFDSLEDEGRHRWLRELRAGLSPLPAEDYVLRGPLVAAVVRRPIR